MVKGGDAARKKAADCMTLAAEASSDERRDMLRPIARSWATLQIKWTDLKRVMSGSESINARKQPQPPAHAALRCCGPRFPPSEAEAPRRPT